jgi:CRISPR-associated protein Cas2
VFIAICYDIPDDRRRARIAAILSDFGRRVQRSVFEADLDERALHRLLQRLSRAQDDATDSIRAYRLCEECRSKIVVLAGPQAYRPPAILVVTAAGPTSGSPLKRPRRPRAPRTSR